MSDAVAKIQTEFYVSREEQTLGPWTIDEIVERLGKSELTMTDFIYEDVKEEWVALLECKPLQERLNRAKPKAPPPAAKKEVSAVAQPSKGTSEWQARRQDAIDNVVEIEKRSVSKNAGEKDERADWHVLRGNQRHGPLKYLDVVKALQDKSIYEFDFVRRDGSEKWVRIAEHAEFAPERIRDLSQKANSEGKVFAQRKHVRTKYESEVIVNNDRTAWMGRTEEMSVEGSGLVIENATLIPGQVLRLHFASTNDLPAFTALAEIVGKKYSSDVKSAKSPVKYAVRFLKVDESAEERLKTYFANMKSERKQQQARQ